MTNDEINRSESPRTKDEIIKTTEAPAAACSNPKFEARNSKQIRRTKIQNLETGRASDKGSTRPWAVFDFGFGILGLFRISDFVLRI